MQSDVQDRNIVFVCMCPCGCPRVVKPDESRCQKCRNEHAHLSYERR